MKVTFFVVYLCAVFGVFGFGSWRMSGHYVRGRFRPAVRWLVGTLVLTMVVACAGAEYSDRTFGLGGGSVGCAGR